MALEDDNKEKGAAGDDRGEHRRVEDPGMNTLDADPEEEESDGKFCEYHCPRVKNVTEPPAVARLGNALRRKVVMMTASSVVYTDIRRDCVEQVEHLRNISDHV